MVERKEPTKQIFTNEKSAITWDDVDWDWPVVFINDEVRTAALYYNDNCGAARYYIILAEVADKFKCGVWLLNGPARVEPTKNTLRADFDALLPPAVASLRVKLIEIDWDRGMSCYIASPGDHDVYGHERSILNFYNACKCIVDYIWLDDVLPDKPGDTYRGGLWVLD